MRLRSTRVASGPYFTAELTRARPQSQVDRGPADAHSFSDGLHRARDVHAAPVSVFTGHVSHATAK